MMERGSTVSSPAKSFAILMCFLINDRMSSILNNFIQSIIDTIMRTITGHIIFDNSICDILK